MGGAISALVRKDLRLFFTDRRAVILSFAIPIAIASFFGTLSGGLGQRSSPARIPVAIVDQDGSAVSKALIAGTAADTALALTQPPLDEARAGVRGGRVAVAVVIPPGFGDAAGRAFFSQATRPELVLLGDPSRAAEVSMVKGMLTGHVMEAVGQEMFTGAQGRTLIDESLRSIETNNMPPEQRVMLRRLLESVRAYYAGSAAAGGAAGAGRPVMGVPFSVRDEAVTANAATPYNSYAHAFAGMGIQFMLFAAIDLAAGILLERERGIWKRLRSAPLSRTTLLLAKAVSGTLLTLVTLLVSFGFAMVVFGVRISGSVPGFLAIAVATAVMASTFGLLVSSIGRTPAATRSVAIFVVLVMVMLGGAWVPAFIFPAWLQTVTLAVPVRWAVDGLDAVTWRGLGAGAAVFPVLALLAFSTLSASLAVWRFRWEE